MGDAFRAVASSNEALFFNVAGLAQAEKYEIDAGYALNRSVTDLSRLDFSVTDSRTSRVAAGLAYTRLTGDGTSGPTEGHIGTLGMAFPFSDVAAFGLSVKYLSFERPDPTNAVTGDLGLFVKAGEWVRVGAAAYNVVDVTSREAPLGAGGGVSIGNDLDFRAAFDAAFDLSRNDETPLSLHAGAEYLAGGAFPLRAGFKRYDAEDRNYLSFGTGYLTPEFGLEGAFVQNLTDAESADRLFSFTLKLFL